MEHSYQQSYYPRIVDTTVNGWLLSHYRFDFVSISPKPTTALRFAKRLNNIMIISV